jgi:hypothetical protein
VVAYCYLDEYWHVYLLEVDVLASDIHLVLDQEVFLVYVLYPLLEQLPRYGRCLAQPFFNSEKAIDKVLVVDVFEKLLVFFQSLFERL